MLVVLDPGHGGTDNGGSGNALIEKSINLKVALLIKDDLNKKGVKVELTRDSDDTISLKDRTNFSNSKKPKCFISIHCNAHGKSTSKGIETFSYNEKTSDLAKLVHSELIKTKCYTIDRGVKHENFHVLRETNARACLVELGFITNIDDSIYLREKTSTFAIAISKAICKYLKIEYKDNNICPHCKKVLY